MPLTQQLVQRILLALVGVMVIAGLASAPALAQQGNIVTFGDSFTSSPNQLFNHARGSQLSSGSSAPAEYPRRGSCLQNPHNWPRQMEQQTGIPVADWSCTAETMQSMQTRIRIAIEAGSLHSGTRAVYFAIGGNDFGPFGWSEGAPALDVPAMNERFTQKLQEAVDIVRSVAPTAQIVLAGYPRVTDGHSVCVLNIIPGLPLGPPVPGFLAEETLRNMQAAGARNVGIQYVDNYWLTYGHHTCTGRDHERYVAGWIDTTSPEWEMMLHPTNLGHKALARNNAAAIGL